MFVVLLILFLVLAGVSAYSFYNSFDGLLGFIAGGLAVVMLFLTVTVGIRSTAKYVTFTVDDKSIAATNSGNGHEYQIYTTDGNVYKDEDSFSFFKFNSSNVYAQLKRGHTYRCEVSGFRIPILSQKNNIIKCSEVSK